LILVSIEYGQNLLSFFILVKKYYIIQSLQKIKPSSLIKSRSRPFSSRRSDHWFISLDTGT